MLHAAIPFVYLVAHSLAYFCCEARLDQICLEDDYTNDLPVFIEKKSICNYDTVPVPVYSIRTSPKYDDAKFCLKGDVADAFEITEAHDLKFVKNLEREQTEVRLKVQIIRIATDIAGTDGERRQAVNAIEFVITILDCNQVSWQTIVVAILSSVCVVLMSFLAIMAILYHQKGWRNSNDDDGSSNRRDAGDNMSYSKPSDETFINPRRTSASVYKQS